MRCNWKCKYDLFNLHDPSCPNYTDKDRKGWSDSESGIDIARGK